MCVCVCVWLCVCPLVCEKIICGWKGECSRRSGCMLTRNNSKRRAFTHFTISGIFLWIMYDHRIPNNYVISYSSGRQTVKVDNVIYIDGRRETEREKLDEAWHRADQDYGFNPLHALSTFVMNGRTCIYKAINKPWFSEFNLRNVLLPNFRLNNDFGGILCRFVPFCAILCRLWGQTQGII